MREDVPRSWLPRLAQCLIWASLLFAASLTFLVPFDSSRNIDLQGIVLMLAGAAGWLAVLLRKPRGFQRHNGSVLLLGAIYSLSMLVSLSVSSHLSYGLLGIPYMRLGVAGLLACIGCGLCLEVMETAALIPWLYALVCAFAFLSLIYTWINFHSIVRIGGLFSQADTFAVIVGCGLLLGVHVFITRPQWRRLVGPLQAILGALLLCSETRAVIGLVILILGAWLIRERARLPTKRLLVLGAALALLLGAVAVIAPTRVTNVAYGSASTRYRLELQSFGLSQTRQAPLLGYGPGNIVDALDCRRITASMLVKTCRQGYYFNSTHNIFLDRVLMFGWVGGLSFFGLVVLIIYRGFRYAHAPIVMTFCCLLISLYYLTNVTNVEVELLLFVLLCHVSRATSRQPKSAASW